MSQSSGNGEGDSSPVKDHGMKDEYGEMDSSGETFVYEGNFKLESGKTLKNPSVRYNCFGELNASRDNVVVVCHALTGNSRLDQWWGGLLGPGRAFDTDRFCVVCANILGSCYGTTGPTTIDPATGRPYGNTFPAVTVRDTVRLHLAMLQRGIKANSVFAVIGGSFGGMQALEFALVGGEFVKRCVPIACGSHHTAWQIGISETQRQAIYADPRWCGGNYSTDAAPTAGLSVARQIAMFSYRTEKGFEAKFGRKITEQGRAVTELEPGWQVRSYLEYQGVKFLSRFDPLTYVRMTEQMDTHDVGRGRGGIEAALRTLTQPTLILSIDSDILYPPCEQQNLHAMIPNSQFVSVRSDDGHDGFLLAQAEVSQAVQDFLRASEAGESSVRPKL